MIGGWVRRLIREPLIHFLVTGAALFAFGGYYGEVDASERRITLDETQVSALARHGGDRLRPKNSTA